MTSQIIALGSINVDFQLRADRWPEPGETLMGQDFLMIGGGKSANVAWLARNLGAEAQLVAHVGSDSLQEIALKPLQQIGVNLCTVSQIDKQSTGVSLIVVPKDGRKGILLSANANEVWRKEDYDAVSHILTDAPSGSILTTNLEIPVPLVKHAVSEANKCGMLVILDPSPAQRLDKELLELGCFLTPNQSEAQHLTDTTIENREQAMEAAQCLVSLGGQAVFVKLGSGGCAVMSANEQYFISPPLVETIDTTGAGDAFAAALSVALLENRTLFESTRFAVAASAHAVTGYGSQPSYPSRAQVDALLRTMND